MTAPEQETCWTLIRGAAAGHERDRDAFVRRYLPTVRIYLRSRWQGKTLASEIDDVIQEVFLALLRAGGALDRMDPQHESGFRGLLYGVTRNAALHAERSRARRVKRVGDLEVDPDQTPADDPTLSRIFDRSYARTLVRQARRVMEQRAAGDGDEAQRRVELLRLRFEEGQPIRRIAAAWAADPAQLHREYSKARRDFRAALLATVLDAECCSPEHAEAECLRLLELLRA